MVRCTQKTERKWDQAAVEMDSFDWQLPHISNETILVWFAGSAGLNRLFF